MAQLARALWYRSRPLVLLSLDGLFGAAAVFLAMDLRFEGVIPPHYAAALSGAMLVSAGGRVLSAFTARLHRWSFRCAGVQDALRIVLAALLGSAVFVVGSRIALPGGLPRSVYVMEFLLWTALAAVLRFGPRVALRWWNRRLRRRAGANRTLVVGYGPAAEMIARELSRDPAGSYDVVGFVTPHAGSVGYRMDGIAFVGVIRDLPDLIRRHAAKMVLLADPDLTAVHIRDLLDACKDTRARFKILPSSFAHRDQQAGKMLLHDLSPDDLLPRCSVAFDEVRLRSLVAGRRVLVTGASGSIGGEMCDQLVRYGAGQLVMVDMNENGLYLRERRLTETAVKTEIHSEVADVREPERLMRLGERYRPEIVIHAAAHKHVPLMERAPEEAVKNNVFGTINVARMAHGCGAERFVLVSTDKAVNPTSVMGVTKRIAEMAVRNLGRKSPTRMTAVRFGNVLGSAGSVLPIFVQQIERGGPVTVTHPDCKRYFMTIPEAVGLVLVAGLGGDGELYVLDMGEQVRIFDLARHVITLSGHVPGDDIPIVFTGLRPGEKLYEELLTEEEEETVAVSERIQIARSPAPPADLDDRLLHLRRLADTGDRAAILTALSALVPTYRRPAAAPLPLASEPTPPEFPLEADPRGSAADVRLAINPLTPTAESA
jgi:FlaA1/EpsC-like NDP-sugar epimerase